MKKIFTKRLAFLILALTLVITMLSGCSGCSSSTTVLEYDSNAFSDFHKNDNDGSGLKNSTMGKIAEVIAASYSDEWSGQIGLIVASRGQDYTSKKYDPDSTVVGDMNLEAAYNVIEMANSKAKEKDSDKTLSKDELADIKENLTAEHVNALIDAFQVSVKDESEGFLGGLLVGIGTALRWITSTLGFGSYVVGICIFAIVIELLMIPFAIKQQKNSIKQASLRPKEMAIRNKYKGRNDQPTMQKMQAEIQELYQRENFSPFNGCWMLLIQFPIIIALYNIVVDPLRYVFGQGSSIGTALNTFATAPKAAGGLGLELTAKSGTIELLSKMGSGDIAGLANCRLFDVSADVVKNLKSVFANLPNFNIGPINFGNTPLNIVASDWTSWVLLLVPILTFVSYFATSKLNRKFMYQSVANEGVDDRQVACSNSMMNITMPAMSAFFALAVPGVIGVYWAFRSWLSFGKTVLMAKLMPLPTFTDEDYKAAAKEMAGKKSVTKSSKAGAVRSLHYIDDEDFEDTRERGLARRAAIEERERHEQEEKAKRAAQFAVPLKKDKKKEAESAQEQIVADQTDPETQKQDNDNDKDEV